MQNANACSMGNRSLRREPIDTLATIHFGTKTLRHHKIGAEMSGHFGPGLEVSGQLKIKSGDLVASVNKNNTFKTTEYEMSNAQIKSLN